MKKPTRKLTLGAALLATGVLSATQSASAAAFTLGNLVVEQIGDGSTALSSAAAPVFVDEINPATATQVQSIALPTTANGASGALVDSGTATSDGYLTLSADRTTLVLPGYNAATGTATVASAAGINRVVGTISSTGAINTTTQFSDGYTTNNLRSVSSPNGATFFTTGTSSTAATGGVRTLTLGSTTSTSVSIAPQTNLRVSEIFNGGLYYSSGTGAGIFQVNTNLSTASGQTATQLIATTASPYGFSISPDGKTVYVADDGAGIAKYTSTSGTAGTFTLAGTYSTAGTTATAIKARGLVVDYTTVGGPTLYATTTATTANTLIDFVDASNFTVTPTTLATASANEVFRGVDFTPSPVPEPTTILGGMLLLGAAGWTLRRRTARGV